MEVATAYDTAKQLRLLDAANSRKSTKFRNFAKFGDVKMKIKVLSRNPNDYIRETKHDIHKVPRNYDPSLHPFQQSREYVRALNATKLERVFAKPFLGCLDGHKDGVHCLAKHPKQLLSLLSGSYDGEVRLWNLAKRRCLANVQAHDGYVRGICVDPNGETFLTVGDDKRISRWSLSNLIERESPGEISEPVQSILTTNSLMDIAHHWSSTLFATCGDGEGVYVWDDQRTSPIRCFNWGVDTVHRIRFNPVETNLLAAAASDRSIILYDCRGQVPLRKVTLKLRSNAIAWNPMEAFVFTVANDDYNLYSFDIRKLTNPINMHMDHVEAVMDVDYSPTGREFVSGGYDKSVRIFPTNHGHSREVYHTKRMQRVMCVSWSSDAKYLLTGSDEMNIRVWKANASEKLGPLRPREHVALNYAEKLKEKYAAHPEIRRIARHRHVPRHVYNARKELRTMLESQKRKEANRRAHSKPGEVPRIPEKKKHIIGEDQ